MNRTGSHDPGAGAVVAVVVCSCVRVRDSTINEMMKSKIISSQCLKEMGNWKRTIIYNLLVAMYIFVDAIIHLKTNTKLTAK